MKEEEPKKNKSIFSYFIKMFLIFILIDIIISTLPSIFVNMITTYKYGDTLIAEIFYGLFTLIVMLLFHNSYVFTNKQEKFGKAISVAIPMLALSAAILVGNIVGLTEFSIGNFINVLALCVFVGITEEFLCRGWLQNEFIERFGDGKKNVITSIIFSSLIFGLIHLVNIFSTTQGVFETILQVINATTLGFLLGCVYYKTKNIWSVIFLHAFYDFAIFIGEMNLVKDCTYGTATTGITIVNCVSIALLSVFWILSSILVIKKCNFPDKKVSRKKSTYSWLITGIIITAIALFIPFDNLVEGYDEYTVCYTYQETDMLENYVTHYPHFDEYFIKHTEENETLFLNENEEVQELVIENNYNFKLYINDLGKVVIENVNTSYSVTLDYTFVGQYGLEVIENDEAFAVVILANNIESTIYYNDYFIKANMSNDDSYLDQVAESFKKFELPVIEQIGYVTLENSNYKYPFFYSQYNDYFIIKNGELFLMK